MVAIARAEQYAAIVPGVIAYSASFDRRLPALAPELTTACAMLRYMEW